MFRGLFQTKANFNVEIMSALIIMCAFGSLAASYPKAVGVLGAPASGKSYVITTIKTAGEKEIAELLKASVKDLTVDIIRNDFRKLPEDIQLYFILRTIPWLQGLKTSKEPQYKHWMQEFSENVITPLNELMPNNLKIEQKNGDFIFTRDKKEVTIDGFFYNLSKSSGDIIRGLIQKKGDYIPFIQVVRYFQYQMLSDFLAMKKGISFDEVGADIETMRDRLEIIHRSGYVLILFLIHPENIGVNFMQNVLRMIRGDDEGRDSSGSIVWSYTHLDHLLKTTYKELSEEMLYVKNDISKNEQVREQIKKLVVQATPADDQAKGNKPVDAFINVSPATLQDTFSRVLAELQQLQKINEPLLKSASDRGLIVDLVELFKSLLFLFTEKHLEHPTTYELEWVKKEDDATRQEVTKKLDSDAKQIKALLGINPDNIEQKRKAAKEAMLYAYKTRKNIEKINPSALFLKGLTDYLLTKLEIQEDRPTEIQKK